MDKMISGSMLILVLAFSAFAKGSRENKGVEIIRTYSGMAAFGYNLPGDGILSCTAPVVIKNDGDYETFIAMIPEYEMTPIDPAPPNDDPLLKRPHIDFNNRMMLVIFSYDPNMFIGLKIEKVEVSGKKMVVTTWYEEVNPDAMVAKILDYGFYYAVVVEKFDGEIVFH